MPSNRYTVCKIGDCPEYFDEIVAFDEEEAVREFALKDYDDDHFEEEDYSVYVLEAPNQYKHLGDYRAKAEYDVNFYPYKIKEQN